MSSILFISSEVPGLLLALRQNPMNLAKEDVYSKQDINIQRNGIRLTTNQNFLFNYCLVLESLSQAEKNLELLCGFLI